MKGLLATFIVVTLSVFAVAQHGTAQGGYFPPDYNGDTWSGTVTAVNPDTREITLTYKDKKRDQSFIGVLKPHYSRTLKDGTTREVQMTDIPVGTYMIAYYTNKSKTENGQKTKYGEIFDFQLYTTPPRK